LGASDKEGLHYDGSSDFFKAIEVNTPMFISPIMMIPEYLTPFELQKEYLTHVVDMNVRKGPLVTNRERLSTRVPVKKVDFVERSTLMAAPIIFQTRSRKTATCPFNYSTEFISKMHAKALEDNCDDSIYSCDAFLSEPISIMACMGQQEDNTTFFGLTPTKFNKQTGYADFLSSITDNKFVFRDGLQHTDGFITSATMEVQVVYVFFTPSTGVVTVLTIAADFSASEAAVETSILVNHYGILEGAALAKYCVLQSVVLLNVAIMFFDVFITISKSVRDWGSQGGFQLSIVVEPFIDFLCGVLVLVYTSLVLLQKTSSAEQTAHILDVSSLFRTRSLCILNSLDSTPWSSSSVPMQEKTTRFFKTLEQLMEAIQTESRNNLLCNIILLITLLRVIQCTNLHPRLAILTGTVANAVDDLWHTAILAGSLMLCFAGIGTWRFGNSLEAFGTYEKTLQTEFDILFGNFPDNWASDPQLERELQVFIVLYLMVLFLLVLNFLLAIIVEAYMKVRQSNLEQQIARAFFTDIGTYFLVSMYSSFYGWPENRVLGKEVQNWQARLSVGYDDLIRTGMFKSPETVVSFLEFYSRYEYMKPPELVGRVKGYFPAPEHLSLREQVINSFTVVMDRHNRKGKKDSAAKIAKLVESSIYDEEESGETPHYSSSCIFQEQHLKDQYMKRKKFQEISRSSEVLVSRTGPRGASKTDTAKVSGASKDEEVVQ
jgi:hypothetical protein